MAYTSPTALRCVLRIGRAGCVRRVCRRVCVVIGAAWDGAAARHCSLRRLQQADSEALLRLVHAADPLWSQRAVNRF